MPQVFDVIRANIGSIVSIDIADDNLDMKQATDVVVNITAGSVAVRVRTERCKYRDWTVRSRSLYGGETELSKLKKGFANWYLYAWSTAGVLSEWMLIDLDKVRSGGILDRPWSEIPNGDGTKFISIPRHVLGNCIVASNIERAA